ncbi:energy transducer TonB [Anaerospora sp.]|uniref:energy transducer TonB n=1 Tax=Anaerospora sp. TaxID=1960278 RepID=UPI00289BA60F|nr:energy transducer TonB [Anaerospora sp.]
MSKRNEWLRALAFSIVIHIGLIICIGWFAAHIFTIPVAEPVVVELDLIADPGMQESSAPGSPAPAASQAVPQQEMVMKTTVPIKQQVIAEIAEAESVITETEAAAQAFSSSANRFSSQGTGSGGESAGSGSGSGSGAGSGGGTGSGTKGLISPPRILQKVEPRYPESVRRDGVEGSVTVKMEIMENGKPSNVWVVGSSGRNELDEAAVKAVERWRFVPARDSANGQPVVCITTVEVKFRLN